MTGRFRGTATRLWAVLTLLACVAASGCGAFDKTEQAAPEPSRRPPLDTMQASDAGDQLTVTAVVTGVSSPRSFTVYDADLPEPGLLVLATTAVRAQDLVTVTGSVVVFTFTRFQDRYDLGDRRVYRRFESRKALVADEVRSWAASARPVSGTG
ncbi:hypothetical protein [Actinoplanes auranticolor]|uniref:Lipoprotein n=1 Tax=Actinoplanes auranticolor TaxID=47988 RepID=A0A919SHK8_9ACTN|nr:hypothetical protein [Actinoplanes auranticolor]GIM71886.1 hypothetical protein Aau02nite_48210 [Actinoplanes auranticolor]